MARSENTAEVLSPTAREPWQKSKGYSVNCPRRALQGSTEFLSAQILLMRHPRFRDGQGRRISYCNTQFFAAFTGHQVDQEHADSPH
jgi:hypothetical protein